MEEKREKFHALYKFLIFCAIIVVCWYLGYVFKISLDDLKNLFNRIPYAVSGPLFVALYVGLTTFIWVGPKDILRIFGAVFFGPFHSTFLIWIGEIFNAAVLFSVSRRLGQEFVQENLRLKKKDIKRAQSNASAWGVFILKNILIFPLRFLDLAFGLSRISLKKYLVVSAIATPVRLFVLQFILAAVGETLLEDPFKAIPILSDYLIENVNVLKWSFYYMLGSFVLMIIYLWLEKRKRKAMNLESSESIS